MNWAGFTGSETELQAWLRRLRHWSERFARRRRRPELAQDIESAALEYLASREEIGSAISVDCERYVSKACDLGDAFTTARDSDLTANLNERMKERDMTASFMETAIADPCTEDDLLAALDGEPREEGRDLEEVLEELDQAEYEMDPLEETMLTLEHYYGYTQREIASYLGYHPHSLWKLKRQIKRWGEFRRLFPRAEADPSFTQVEVSWIRI